MGKTSIEWCTDVWNPVSGCTKVSQGCKNCYAERVFPRVYGGQIVRAFPSSQIRTETRKRRFADIQVHPDRLDAPLRWRKPRRIFVNSMSDLFHENVPFAFIHSVFQVMAQCRQHTFQVLTKRPARMADFYLWDRCYMLDHVWPGVSVEDQETADERIPLLLKTAAAVRFVSYEPALGPVDFSKYLGELSWVIVGGESGPGARPFDVQWARGTIAQCKTARVPCFVKQVGRRPVWSAEELTYALLKLMDPKGGDWTEWPEDLRVRQYP